MNTMLPDLASPRLTQWDPEHADDTPADPKLRPALFARYGQLESLRYDYPLVLVEGDGSGPFMRSLCSVIDGILQELAPPGAAGERMRRDLLQLEAEIRARVMGGAEGALSELWSQAEDDLAARCDASAKDELSRNLDLARDRLNVDGAVIDCDAATPAKLLVHAWRQVQAAKAKAFRKRVEGLILRLSDILKADYMKSDKARKPEALKSAIGDNWAADFDFEELSRVLTKKSHDDELSEDRRKRVQSTLMVLQSQRFYAPGRASAELAARQTPYGFVFDNCADALDAFRARLPEMVDFVKAITIAELEIVNRYRPMQHDSFFARFDENELGEEELALLPSYLVCLRDGHSEAAETAHAFETLASGLPVKVLIQIDDILGGASPEPPRASFGGGSARLAAMAVGVHDAFVMQAAASDLYRLRDALKNGLTYDGPALFSIYSGATETVSGVPPYLLAAAAKESRAFPTFTYDPAAGPDRVSRFSLGDNPQSGEDWPRHGLSFEDADQQHGVEEVAFTHADFAICDKRYAKHRLPVAPSQWHESMIPVDAHVRLAAEERAEKVPYVWVIDEGNILRRAVIDDKIVRGARRALEVWRSLQELSGVNDPSIKSALAKQRAAWEKEKEAALASLGAAQAAASAAPSARAAEVPAPKAPAAPAAVAAEPEPEERADPDAPYIETPRCTSCNECTYINNKMFAYNENQQAYVADPDAGTYRQLVEAAESCQVSIIHPGKPRNPDEPDLEELIARAEPFN
ncbi:MAG: ferredoxin [Hyphomicrobiales bacterium]|nr:ferredoxin [Hyphomicrobiales bacterium]